jgi:hypothetical protein
LWIEIVDLVGFLDCGLRLSILGLDCHRGKASVIRWNRENRQSAIDNRQSAIGNPQSAIGNRQSAIGNRQSYQQSPIRRSSIPNPQSAIDPPDYR